MKRYRVLAEQWGPTLKRGDIIEVVRDDEDFRPIHWVTQKGIIEYLDGEEEPSRLLDSELRWFDLVRSRS